MYVMGFLVQNLRAEIEAVRSRASAKVCCQCLTSIIVYRGDNVHLLVVFSLSLPLHV